MTDNQIVFFVTLLVGISYWFFIHRKLQRKNQLLVTICAYILIIIDAWTGSDDSWKLALLKTIAFGMFAVDNIGEMIKLRKNDNIMERKEI
jgi:hypothetical protein